MHSSHNVQDRRSQMFVKLRSRINERNNVIKIIKIYLGIKISVET
jgi:hypothetical protein